MPKSKASKPIVVNPNRNDPYKNFKFRVKFGGKIVVAATSASGLRKIPGMHKNGTITLKRGVIPDSGFAKWVNQTAQPDHAANSAGGLHKPTRRTFVVEMRDETGGKTGEWKLHSCKVRAVNPSRSKNSNGIESLTLQAEAMEKVEGA